MTEKVTYTDREKNFVRGYFQIRVLHKDTREVLEEFEKENVVVNNARVLMSRHMSGQLTTPINKIIFGTKGVNPGTTDVARPITADRTQIFSQEERGYMYEIYFTPPLQNGDATNIKETDKDSGSEVRITRTQNTVNYRIIMSEPAGNTGGTSGNSTPYSECGMYVSTGEGTEGSTGGESDKNQLFAMRTFAVRSKDANSIIEVNWTFVF